MAHRTDTSLWSYDSRFDTLSNKWTGYDVEALDGHIGTIDEQSNDVGRSCVIVDTGPWIFGKKRMVPASYVTNVDPNEQKVFIGMTKAQIKDAPDYDELRRADENYFNDTDRYYGSLR